MSRVLSLLEKEKFNTANVKIPEGLELQFTNCFSHCAIISACKNADFLFAPASAGKISAELQKDLPTIQMIQTMGVGFDHIDLESSMKLGIPVANVPGANASAVAEHTIGCLIVLQRRIIESDAALKSGNYASCRNILLRDGLQEIRNCNIGLIGFGNIARAVATVAHALGANVHYYSRKPLPPEIEKQYHVSFQSFNSLLSSNNVISVHVPLTEQTRGLIGSREISLMPVGTILINTARGEIIDIKALSEALEIGHLAGAALDTFTPEPPDPENPLFHLTPPSSCRLLLTPHTAGVTLGSYRRMIDEALQNIQRVASGQSPRYIVNGIWVRNRLSF